MKLPRRKFLQFAAVAAAAPAFSRLAMAQAYPSRPITMIVPFLAGGPTDALARVLADPMAGSLGQPIIIENVSGADGRTGTGWAARARPDGYTIELGAVGTHALNGALYSLPYDVLNDFAPISPVVTLPRMCAYKAHSFKKKLRRNSLLCLIAAMPPQCRTWWQARSTCYSVRRTRYRWCGPEA